ncbi:uncharacterized protein LOC134543177 isoform X2 [Bacillus rossius redtenbacheri]
MSESEEDSSAASSDEWPVTADWLEAVLAAHHRRPAAVADFSVRPGCDAGESVLSDILAVQVAYRLDGDHGDEPRRLSLIVKLLPHDPFSRYFVTEAQFDLREIKFYTQVVPELDELQRRLLAPGAAPLQLPIPRCYHARYAAPGADSPRASPVALCESVLVLENLKALGYQSADFSRGLSLRQAAAALDSVARLHALSLALKVKEGRPLDERYPFLFQTSKATDSYQQLVERGLPQLARFLEKRAGMEPVLEALAALRPATKELIASLLAPREPMALITHTDFWCNNLLFRDGEDGRCACAVLDWQMVTYSGPTNDVALLLVSSLPTELRRGRTRDLLDGYWAALLAAASALGVDVQGALGYGRDDLARDYRRSQLLALLLCVGSVDVALGDALTEQRLLDVLADLHGEGVLSPDLLSA